jgi:hypothetical protein
MLIDRALVIFSQYGEPGTYAVTEHLRRMGVSYVRLDYEAAYLESSWTFHDDDDFCLAIRGTAYSRENIGYFWNRRWGIPFVPESFGVVDTNFAFSELNSCFSGLYELTIGQWANDVVAERRWSNKISQLRLAKRIGMRTPRTLTSSDPSAVRAFYEREQKVVFKSTSGTSPFLQVYSDAAHRVRETHAGTIRLHPGIDAAHTILFTQELDESKLQLIDSIKWGPATFQQLIRKRADVRVSVIGDVAIACLIDSQRHLSTKLGFRRFAYGSPIGHTLIDIPSEVACHIRT